MPKTGAMDNGSNDNPVRWNDKAGMDYGAGTRGPQTASNRLQYYPLQQGNDHDPGVGGEKYQPDNLSRKKAIAVVPGSDASEPAPGFGKDGVPSQIASSLQYRSGQMSYMGHFADPSILVAGHNVAHPGFKAVQGQIAKSYGGNMKKAGAILASRTRAASASAKKKNPRLKKVKG